MDDDHSMPENDAAMLRQIVGLRSDDLDAVLPKELATKYWELKRCCDRIGVHPSPRELAMISMLCGYGKPNKKEAAGPGVVELFKAKQIKHGDPVEVMFRNKVVEGKFQAINASGKALVEVDGEVREFDPSKVMQPQAV